MNLHEWNMNISIPLEIYYQAKQIPSSIRFCLDNDEPGRKASLELSEKYYGLGYEVEDSPPPSGFKDYNEWLVAKKRDFEVPMSCESKKCYQNKAVIVKSALTKQK